MENHEISEGTHSFFCFRCGCIIEAGGKMVSLSVSLETPAAQDVVEIIEASSISTLCLNCAAVLLGQAIAGDPSLMMPLPEELRSHREEREEAA